MLSGSSSAFGQAKRLACLRADQVRLGAVLEEAGDVVGVLRPALKRALVADADLVGGQGAPAFGHAAGVRRCGGGGCRRQCFAGGVGDVAKQACGRRASRRLREQVA